MVIKERLTRIGKNLTWFFQRRFQSQDFSGYDPHKSVESITEHAFQVARSIRGSDRGSAIILHSVMPRSGSVYTGELLRLHHDLYSYPNDIWELPFVENIDDILAFQRHFFRDYDSNRDRMGENDFLPLFGASIIAYLQSFAPEEQRIFVRRPIVKHLNYFFSIFPYENLLFLMRDGRDVVSSTMRTWPLLKFKEVCAQWDHSARMILNLNKQYSEQGKKVFMARFEDVVRDPEDFVRKACESFDLALNNYPFEKISDIMVHGSSTLKKFGKVSWKPVEKPQNFKPGGHWQQWPAETKKIFKKLAGQTLIEAGYCEDLDW